MNSDFDRILDECIDRINRGQSIEACLKDYPGHESELAPLLRSMYKTQNINSFKIDDDKKRSARQRFYTVLDKQKTRGTIWQQRPALLATIIGVIAILLIGFFALRATVFTNQIPVTTVSNPSSTGNFVFLVSDAPNDIGDFNNLFITVSKVGLLQSGSKAQWVEFVPETRDFDLTLLPGDKTQELWRGDVPEGSYTKAVIYVSSVHGLLKATGETISIKLPGDKLQLSEAFQVSAGSITSFTYDITVIKTGNGHNLKYILKPQTGESGTQTTQNNDIQDQKSNLKNANKK